MKVWHKILVSPGVAIVFLIAVGAMSYSVLTRQHSALVDLFDTRFANYQLAANSSLEISGVHSSVYRLFTWIGNLNGDMIKKITGRAEREDRWRGQENDRVQGARQDLDEDERKIAESLITHLAKYKKDVDSAIEQSTIDVNFGMSGMMTADSGFQANAQGVQSAGAGGNAARAGEL